MPYIGNPPAERYSKLAKQDLTGDGTVGAYTLDYAVGSVAEIEVFVNNVRQEPTEAYTVAGDQLTMTGTVASTDDFYVVFQGKAIASGQVPEKQSDGSYVYLGNVDINGNELILDADADTSITADTDDQIDIKIGGSDVASFTSNGLKMVSGKGIDFSATSDTAATGATANSELLDDYEEGTWTPSDESGASQTFTFAGQPYYTKIGNIVTVQAFINVPSNSSGNAVQIGSLPFSIATDAYGSGSCFNNANAGHHLVYVDSGTGTFYVRDDNNSSMSMTQASTKFLCITVTYRAS
jgi:hypothetical protein